MKKYIEFYQEKRKHREEMREVLPPALQLEFPEKKKWSFEGKLLKLKESQEPEDRLFFEILKMKIKKRIGKEITNEDKEKIEKLNQESKEKRERQSNFLELFINFQQCLSSFNLKEDWRDFAKVAIKGIESGIITEKKDLDEILSTLKTAESWSDFANVAAKGIESGIITEKKHLLKDFQQGLSSCKAKRDWFAFARVAAKGIESGIITEKKDLDEILSTLKTAESWPDFADVAIKGIESGIFKIEPPSQLIKILKEKSQANWQIYDYQIIALLLKKQEDLGEFFLKYKPTLFSLIKYFKDLNQELPKEKQTDDPEKFLEKYQLEIAQLHYLDLDLSTAWLNQYLKNFGFPRLESFLKNVVKGFNFKSLKDFLPKIKNINPEYFSRLIEISSAYQRANLDKDLNEVLEKNTQKEINSLDLIRILGKNLLEKFAQKLNIKAEIKESAFDEWNLEYLPKLFTAEAQYESEDKELLKLIMKLSFQEKSFLPSLFGQIKGKYDSDEKEYLEEIKKYNLKVKEKFENYGLNFEKWLNYDKKLEFQVGLTKDQLEVKRKAFEQELFSTVKELLGSYREKKEGILSDQEAKIVFNKIVKKYNIQFKEGEIIHSKKGKLTIKDIEPVLKDFISEIEKIYQTEKERTKKENIGTALSHLKDLEKRLPDLEKELLRKGFELEIKNWQREPGYDIFQGNYTHCCVAVENFNRGAMLDYLIDTNLQVVEVKDKIEDKTIAQTWLFVAKDSSNNLNLILDNVEINSDYSGLEPEIRENLFNYLKEYTKSFSRGKIKRILLGASSYNDIETERLDSITLSQTKLAGCPRETQYLDAFGSAWVNPSKDTLKTFFIIAEDLEKEEIKKK